jgi:hypothetical protein
MTDLLTTLLAIKKIAGDPKFETLQPMREINRLAGQALDLARLETQQQAAGGPGRKQLVVIESPSPEDVAAIEAKVSAKLTACGIAHEVLVLHSGQTFNLIEGEPLETTEGGGAPQARPDPAAPGSDGQPG